MNGILNQLLERTVRHLLLFQTSSPAAQLFVMYS